MHSIPLSRPTFEPESEAPSQAERASVTRALQELEAAKARVERDARKVHDETRGKLIAELLPVLDDLDRTIRAATDRGAEPALLDGTRQVRSQFERVLAGYGVQRIDALGTRFDPSVHDAIGVTPVASMANHGIVLDQTQPGYRFGDRLLRPARVVVGERITTPRVPPR
jgi:molecular chaperone GrpE